MTQCFVISDNQTLMNICLIKISWDKC